MKERNIRSIQVLNQETSFTSITLGPTNKREAEWMMLATSATTVALACRRPEAFSHKLVTGKFRHMRKIPDDMIQCQDTSQPSFGFGAIENRQ